MMAFQRHLSVKYYVCWSRCLHEQYGTLLQKYSEKLEDLGDRRPPWPKQIITPIFLNVIMLSLGGERLTPKLLDHYLYNDLGMLPLLWGFFCSFTHLRIPKSLPKFTQIFIVQPKTPP